MSRPMLRTLIRTVMTINTALCLAFLLIGCAGHGNPPGPDAIPPKAPSPIICEPADPEPTPAGGIVRPITAEEIDLTDRFLDAEIDVRRWGREGWRRLAVARDQFCR